VDETKPKPPARPLGPGGAPAAPGAGEAHTPERQRTIDVLCEAFANDELEVEEFERRVEAAHRATSSEELRRLLAGLPSATVPAPLPKKGSPAAKPAGGVAPAPAPVSAPYLGEVREWSLSVGILGGMSRTGNWIPARRNVAIGVMGGCEIDLREAQLPPGVTEIFVVAFWGGVEVVVSPWVHVEVSGIGIMGGFEHSQDTASAAPPGAPVVRISGVAMMGGAEVSVRYPGESSKEARRRVKEERRVKRLPGSAGRSEEDVI
jgi:hypothetical protein